jgi:hypothetical protein
MWRHALVHLVWQGLVEIFLIGTEPVHLVWQLPEEMLRRRCDHGVELPHNVVGNFRTS